MPTAANRYTLTPGQSRCKAGFVQDPPKSGTCVKKGAAKPTRTQPTKPAVKPNVAANRYTLAAGSARCKPGYAQTPPKSGTCGKKGAAAAPKKQVHFAANVKKNSGPLRLVYTPLTLNQIKLNMKGSTSTFTPDTYHTSDTTVEHMLAHARRLYDTNDIFPLTPAIAEHLIDKKIKVLTGTSWIAQTTKTARVKHIEDMLVTRVAFDEGFITIVTDDEDVRVEGDNYTASIAVTGSGDDPVFVFAHPSSPKGASTASKPKPAAVKPCPNPEWQIRNPKTGRCIGVDSNQATPLRFGEYDNIDGDEMDIKRHRNATPKRHANGPWVKAYDRLELHGYPYKNNVILP